jgi:hydrogenase expression/formation protein HypD
MNVVDPYRDPRAAVAVRRRIDASAARLPRTVRVMEICGTHTMAIARHGIRGILPSNVDLVSGPGCPVCVTPPGYIDAAIALARRGVAIVTFGDLLNVPGSDSSLGRCRADGAQVETCYSPDHALAVAVAQPAREVVFLAIGFETTIGPVVNLVPAALAAGVRNVSLLTAFKLVPPALHALMADPGPAIDAFLCPAHVSAVIGTDAYRPFATRGAPCVVTGFEPLDILMGLEAILAQLVRGEACVENEYRRVVQPGGNPAIQALLATYLEPADADWRGLGRVPASGLRLRPEFVGFDAAQRHGVTVGAGREPAGCRCGEVIKGMLKPPGCPLFGTRCVPEDPVGPCMVSSEGTCAAWYKYRNL